MKKRLPKLALHLESLRVLDAPGLAGAVVATQVNTCQTSCAPTCGASPGAAHAAHGRLIAPNPHCE